MKRLLLLSALSLAGLLNAQTSFLVTDPNTGSPANTQYYFWVGANDPTVTLEFPVKNTSSNTIKSRVNKNVITTVSGQDIYFCYGSNCYTPFVFNSNPVNLTPGQQLPNGTGTYGVRTDFDANGVVGLSIVRYTLYDSLNHADSISVTITYNVTPNSIKNASVAALNLNASPNPASNSVNFNYDLNSATNASVRIYNSLGNLVKTVSLSGNSKNTQVDVSALEEGFYFYSVISDGKAVLTRRLVIAR